MIKVKAYIILYRKYKITNKILILEPRDSNSLGTNLPRLIIYSIYPKRI